MRPFGKCLCWSATKRNEKDVSIHTDFTHDLFPVSGDRVQLQQVVLNLVMNAIEAMSTVGERPRELLNQHAQYWGPGAGDGRRLRAGP